jgi:hypothetical protein
LFDPLRIDEELLQVSWHVFEQGPVIHCPSLGVEDTLQGPSGLDCLGEQVGSLD